MSAPLEPHHRVLIEVLVSHDVRFVLVGGTALQLHGYSGVTQDVDVTIAVDEVNGRHVEAALAAMHAQPFLVGERGSAYRTDFGQVEVMRWTDGVGDYDAWVRNATSMQIADGLSVLVGSPSDLLLSKEQAGRTKDEDALPRIRAELLGEGKLNPGDVRGPVAELPGEVTHDPRVEELLGVRPTSPRARGLWDHAAELIEDYRDRWTLPDDGDLLGPIQPAGTPQGADRASLDRQLERLGRLLDRDGGERDYPER